MRFSRNDPWRSKSYNFPLSQFHTDFSTQNDSICLGKQKEITSKRSNWKARPLYGKTWNSGQDSKRQQRPVLHTGIKEVQRFVRVWSCHKLSHLPAVKWQARKRGNTAQQIMLKALEAGSDPYLGFLDFCNIPTEGRGTSPAQHLLGQRTKPSCLLLGDY